MISIESAADHFETADSVMAAMLRRALSHERPLRIPKKVASSRYFDRIVETIVSQQLSVKASDAIYKRMVAGIGAITPRSVIETDPVTLRNFGLSSSKVRYIRDNALLWNSLPLSSLARMEDDEVIAVLTSLSGIGRWSAEMFLIFSLGRRDVFSFGDLGLMQSLYRHYGFHPHWQRKIKTTVEAWAPHRTVASLVLWHQRDNSPLSAF